MKNKVYYQESRWHYLFLSMYFILPLFNNLIYNYINVMLLSIVIIVFNESRMKQREIK